MMDGDFGYVTTLTDANLADKLDFQALVIETGNTEKQLPIMEFCAVMREAAKRLREEKHYPDNYNFD